MFRVGYVAKMPELPEVETTRRGLLPFVEGQKLLEVLVNVPRLRTEMPPELAGQLIGRLVVRLERRAKYLLFGLDDGATVLVHLGMSGRFVIVPEGENWVRPKHAHVEMVTPLARLVLIDPRCFGMFVRVDGDVAAHPLMSALGPEPLGEGFTPDYLQGALKATTLAVKVALMTNRIVVGVGNIYASEALFRAGIKPGRRADKVTRAEVARLHRAVREVLAEAIAAGGSTLKDYAQPDGQLGYFAHDFKVYGRAGQPCRVCGTPIEKAVMGQRATFWCPVCQR